MPSNVAHKPCFFCSAIRTCGPRPAPENSPWGNFCHQARGRRRRRKAAEFASRQRGREEKREQGLVDLYHHGLRSDATAARNKFPAARDRTDDTLYVPGKRKHRMMVRISLTVAQGSRKSRYSSDTTVGLPGTFYSGRKEVYFCPPVWTRLQYNVLSPFLFRKEER